MFVPFHDMPASSRVWIYQSDRKLLPAEQTAAAGFLATYCENWKAHGMPLKASFDLRFDHFVILAADEGFNSTSGCSIDDSVRAVKALQQTHNVDFFNRNLVAFKLQDQVTLIPMAELKEKFRNGMLNAYTLTFNNLVATRAELEAAWLTPTQQTWLKRYIPFQTVHS